MKLIAKTISKKLTQCIACTAFVLLAPSAFADKELALAAPHDTPEGKELLLAAPHDTPEGKELVLAAPQDTLAQMQKNLLKIPVPHRDLSVYDEEPVHYHYAQGAALQTLVISPVRPSLPTPSTTPPQKVVKVSAQTPVSNPKPQAKTKPKAKASAAVPLAATSEDSIDDQDDKKADSRFSLQHAAGLGDDSRVQINGFLSAGGLYVNNRAYYQIPGYGNVHNQINSAADTRIGLQVTGNILHNLSVVGQFVADGDNTVNQQPFNVNADWAYLRYTLRPEIQLRAGRIRVPALFYSENAEVGFTYPWIVLPNEVYGIVPVINVNGISSVSSLALGQSNWVVKSQSFYGSSTNQATAYATLNPNLVSGTVVNFAQDNVYGSMMSIGDSIFELRGLYMTYRTTVTAPLALPVCPDGTRQVRCTLVNQAGSTFWSAGAKLDIDHFLLIGEYAHRSVAAIISAINSYYVMAAYQFRGFMPNLTYAYAGTTNNATLVASSGQFAQVQDSLTLGLDYTINSNLLAKLSLSGVQPLNGTFGFFNTNPGRKTIMMYGVSLDAIF